MTFQAVVEQAANEELSHVYDHLLGHAECVEVLEVADRALGAIRHAMA